ncbi:MAG: hypothetical protein MJK12_15660 [Colwellia sp.]|nr:hypothetical protein [Colwellia sp.]
MLEENSSSKETSVVIATSETSATNARRSFLRKAAIGTPIIIASSTQPAWGAACSSGLMSGNVSDHALTCDISGGLSHGHWKEHWIGKSRKHYISNDENKKLKAKDLGAADLQDAFIADNYKHYYVKYGQNHHVSPYKKTSKLDNVKFQVLLKGGDRYDREIVTALISASFNGIISSNFYPFSVGDILDMHDRVSTGDEKANDIASMLENIHKGLVQPD